MEKLISFSEFETRRRARRRGFDLPLDPCIDFENATARILNAAATHDTTFLSRVPDVENNCGIRVLKTDPRYKFLCAIFADRVNDARAIHDLYRIRRINNPYYWHFPGDNTAYFLGPAHLVRSTAMAQSLGEIGVRFSRPDTDGRMPIHFIRQYATDPNLIPYLIANHKIDPGKTTVRLAVGI